MTKYAIALFAIWLSLGNVHAAPPCVPMIPGTAQRLVGEPKLYQNTDRAHAYWFCEDGAGKRSLWSATCTYGHDCLSLDVVAGALKIAGASDANRAATFSEVYRLKYNCDAPISRSDTSWQALACREHLAIRNKNKAAWIAALPAYVPWTTPAAPVEVWKMKPPIAPATTRPAYTLTVPAVSPGSAVLPVRGTKEMARVPKDTVCKPAGPRLASGADAWMTYDATGYVVLCSKVAP